MFSVSATDPYCGDEETLEFFKVQNKENFLYIPGTLPFLVTSTPVVEVIFLICQLLNQSSEVRFMAVDLFDKFMRNHFVDVNNHLDVSCRNRSHRRREWNSLKLRMKKQTLLRLLSCVQLASKLVLQKWKLNAIDVQRILAKSGHSYSLKSITKSELRVLKSVNFKIPVRTPLTYVDTLLGCLQIKLRKELQGETNVSQLTPTLYSVCLSVLDISYLQRQELFHRFFWMATSRWERTPQERMKFLEVECDYVFLAASVILCSIHIWKNDSFLIALASKQLSQLTDIPVKEIKGFATLIFHAAFGSRTLDLL